MPDRVDACAGRHAARLREREDGIEDGDTGRRLRIAARHFLVRLLVGDQREGLTFAACAGGRRNRDERQHWPCCLADAHVILHPAAVGQQKIGSLRRIHAAAAANRHNQVRLRGSCHCQALIDIFRGGIFAGAIINRHGNTRRRQRLPHAGRMPRNDDARIGDQQHFLPPELAREFADSFDGVSAKDETCAGLPVEVHARSKARRL